MRMSSPSGLLARRMHFIASSACLPSTLYALFLAGSGRGMSRRAHQNRPIRKMRMDQEIAALPVGHLKLAARLRRAAAKFKTIGELRAALETRGKKAPRWTPLVQLQIEAVLQDLASATETAGLAGWDR